MARPRSFDTAEVQTKLRDAFWRRGFAGTSIQNLVSDTGLRAGSLHAVFGDKDALFSVALKDYDHHFTAVMDTGQAGAAAIASYLNRLLDAVLNDPDAKGCLIVQAALEHDNLAEPTQSKIDERLTTMHSFFVARLGEEGLDDPELANVLFGTALSILALARARIDGAVLASLTQSALHRLDSALASRGSS